MGNANLENRPLRRRVLLVLSLLAAGLVLLPLSVYVFGQQVVGPYEGSGGIIGFTGSIYAGLLRGEASAWLLVASPALLATCWIGLRRATRRQPQARHGAARAAPDTTQS
jgi:hypothetical protein